MKTTPENAILEQKLLCAIVAGTNKFDLLCAAVGKNPSSSGQSEEFREVDRRLQSMRKRGLIEYSRQGGWRALKP